MSAPETTITSAEIRKRGVKKLVIAGSLFVANVLLLLWFSSHSHGVHFPIVATSFPLAVALIGSIEFITGAPFQRLGDRCISLQGWQRGVLSTFIVIGSLAIIMCLVTFFVMMFT